jgi:hypothetical protein
MPHTLESLGTVQKIGVTVESLAQRAFDSEVMPANALQSQIKAVEDSCIQASCAVYCWFTIYPICWENRITTNSPQLFEYRLLPLIAEQSNDVLHPLYVYV